MTQQATCEKKRALILPCCFWGSTMPILQSRSHRELHGVWGKGTSVVLPSTHSSTGSCCVLHVWCKFFFFSTFQFLIQQLNFWSNSYDNGYILDSYISKALEKTTLLIPGNPYFKQWNNFFPLLQTPPNSINPLPFRLPHPQVMPLFSVSEEVLKKTQLNAKPMSPSGAKTRSRSPNWEQVPQQCLCSSGLSGYRGELAQLPRSTGPVGRVHQQKGMAIRGPFKQAFKMKSPWHCSIAELR